MSDIDPKSARQDPSQLLHYSPKFGVLICKPCQYAIQPGALPRHLRDIHRICRGARRPYLRHVRDLSLIDGIPDSPAQADFPVSHLAVHDGFRCEAEGCAYLCLSVKRMQMHWPAGHGCKGESGRDWSRVPMQTFFQGTMLRYFAGPRREVCSHSLNRHSGKRSSSREGESPAHEALLKTHDLDDLDALTLAHYFTHTHKGFLIGPEASHVWLSVVPSLAVQHSFILHGLLAFTAQHMSYLGHPRWEELLPRSACHKDVTFPAFREALENPTKENCDAVMILAYLLLVMALGAEANARGDREYERDSFLLVRTLGVDDGVVLPQWLLLMRSGCSMLGPFWGHIKTGPIRSLLVGLHAGPVTDADAQPYLDRLLSFIPSDSSWTANDTKTYKSAAKELATAFASSNHQDSTTRTEFIRTWNILALFPLHVDDAFLELLTRAHPAALLLMAHYCVLLKRLDGYWYFRGRAESLFGQVEELLEERWMPCVDDARVLVHGEDEVSSRELPVVYRAMVGA